MPTTARLDLLALAAAISLIAPPTTTAGQAVGGRPMAIPSVPVTPADVPLGGLGLASPTARSLPQLEVTGSSLHVTMDGGFAVATEELTIEVRAVRGYAATFDLGVPAMSELVSLEACQAGACRAGSAVTDAAVVFQAAESGPHTPGTAPLVLASRDGERVHLRAAGLEVGTVTIRVVWSATTERIGGRERLRMPARDRWTDVALESASLDGLTVDGEVELTEAPIGRAFDLVGTPPVGAPSVEVGRVDARGTGFARVSVPPRPARARPVVILVDASPSALRRVEAMTRALTMLLEETPDGSRVSVIAYGRRARTIADGDVLEVRRNGVTIPGDLGPSTSLRGVLAQLEPLPADASLVWLDDGASGASGGESDARDRLLALGARELVVQPSGVHFDAFDPEADPLRARARLTALFSDVVETMIGGRVVRVRAGEAAFVPLRSIDAVPTTAVSSSVPAVASAPVVLAALGEEHARALLTLDPRDRVAASKSARGHPGVFVAGGGFDRWRGRRLIGCGCGGQYGSIGAASRESIARSMAHLRGSVDACFSDARAGRPDYEGRATFVLVLADDELQSATVETDDPALRSCLLDTLDQLVVPAAGEDPGITVVRYPFVSPPLDRTVAPSLATETAAILDTTFATEPSVPPMSVLENLGETDSPVTQ